MNKKGVDLTAEWILNLILLLFILFTFFAFVTKITDDTIHLQEKDVRELALLRDASLASPGDLEVEYRLQPEYDFEIDRNCRISLKKGGQDAAAAPAQFFCANSKDDRVKQVTKEGKLASQVAEVKVA